MGSKMTMAILALVVVGLLGWSQRDTADQTGPELETTTTSTSADADAETFQIGQLTCNGRQTETFALDYAENEPGHPAPEDALTLMLFQPEFRGLTIGPLPWESVIPLVDDTGLTRAVVRVRLTPRGWLADEYSACAP